MPFCLLARHGRSTANADGMLAGWTPGVGLDDTGRRQAEELSTRLADVPVVHVVTSPLQRCHETAAPLLARLGLEPEVHEGLAECRYGAWTGRPLRELAREPLWRTVQDDPARAAFPPSPDHEAESLTQMYERAVAAVADVDARVAAEHGPHAAWVAVSHGDIIKAVLADAVGGGLERFQRMHVDPASVSVVHRADGRSMLLRSNDTGRPLAVPAPPAPAEGEEAKGEEAEGDEAKGDGARPGDAVVGGGAG